MTQTFGKYQLVKKLATGGMAEVWLAKQTGIEGFNRHVVVKRILPHLAEDPEFVQMFLNEAKIASRFNHPNIAQIYDLGETNGQYFIAMEFIHGEDLGRVMRKAWSTGQWIARHIALRIVADACQGLYYAHTRLDDQGRPLRVVHRDISPQNILISFDGAVKVVDFGIAKASDQVSNTKSGAIKGKFAYMAPEQAAGKPLDARSDLFALGLVLYELATGVRPLKRESELATLQAALEGKIEHPSAVAEVPPELDDIIMRALARAPDDRYSDAREFQRALDQYLLDAKELATSAEVSELMAALFADRLSEEAQLGSPNPSTDSSTNNPASSWPNPPAPPAEPPPIRASPNVTMDESALPEEDEGPEPDQKGGVAITGGYELPAGTMVPSRRYVQRESTVTARPSRSEMTRAAPEDEAPIDEPAPKPPPRRRQSSVVNRQAPDATTSDEPVLDQRRRPSSFIKKRPTGTEMPEAPPRRSRPSMPAQKPSDSLSRLVDVQALKDQQSSRLKALVAVLAVVSLGILGVLFRDRVMELVAQNGLIETGTPVRLNVDANPSVTVKVLPKDRSRGPRTLGGAPLSEPALVYVGDTIQLVNPDRGILYEEVIGPHRADELITISKTFKEVGVRFKITPNLRGAEIYRGGLKIGTVGTMGINLFPGRHELEVRAEQLKAPVPFTLEVAENAKPFEKTVDVASAVEKSDKKQP